MAKDENPYKDAYADINYYCGLGILRNLDYLRSARAYCRVWSCYFCRRRKIKTLQYNIIRAVEKHNLDKFLTLTLSSDERKKLSKDQSYKYMCKKWDNLLKRMRRKFNAVGMNVSYIFLPRGHKDGVCHAHVLLNRWIPKKWLIQQNKELGLGFSNIKRVGKQNIARYVAHLGNDKKDHEFWIPKFKRHYSKSRNVSFTTIIDCQHMHRLFDRWEYEKIDEVFCGTPENKPVLDYNTMMWTVYGWDPPSLINREATKSDTYIYEIENSLKHGIKGWEQQSRYV